MARLKWTERAIDDLDEIASYIAVDNPGAAKRMVKHLESHLAQLEAHPFSGPIPPELPGSGIRQIVEPPCRAFYRVKGETVFVIRVLRFERLLRPGSLTEDEE